MKFVGILFILMVVVSVRGQHTTIRSNFSYDDELLVIDINTISSFMITVWYTNIDSHNSTNLESKNGTIFQWYVVIGNDTHHNFLFNLYDLNYFDELGRLALAYIIEISVVVVYSELKSTYIRTENYRLVEIDIPINPKTYTILDALPFFMIFIGVFFIYPMRSRKW